MKEIKIESIEQCFDYGNYLCPGDVISVYNVDKGKVVSSIVFSKREMNLALHSFNDFLKKNAAEENIINKQEGICTPDGDGNWTRIPTSCYIKECLLETKLTSAGISHSITIA